MEMRAKDPRYRIEPQGGEDGGLPLVIQPRGDARVGHLCEWLRERPDWVQDRLTAHGALLFRGFEVDAGEDFEQVARSVYPELKNEYLRTSPSRRRIPSSRRIHGADPTALHT